MKIKGAVLAGGYGTRLKPMTNVTNKHLLPLYDEPMIFHSLKAMAYLGVKDVVLVVGPEHAGHFSSLLGDGRNFGLNLFYKIQMEAGGIAHALKICKDYFENSERIAVILGDNIFGKKSLDIIQTAVLNLQRRNQKDGAMVVLKRVYDPTRFGVASISLTDNGLRIKKIVEKPKISETNLAVTGLYIYDRQIWDILDGLVPSHRGELEITDVNNMYVEKKQLDFELLENEEEWWVDAGNPDSLFYASCLIRAEKREENIKEILEDYAVFINIHKQICHLELFCH